MATSNQPDYKAFRFRAQKTVGAPGAGAASMETLSGHATNPNAHPMYMKKGEGSTDTSMSVHKADMNAHSPFFIRRSEVTQSLLDYTQSLNKNYVDDSKNFTKDYPTPHIITSYVLYRILQNLGINDFKPENYILVSKIVKSTITLSNSANSEEYVPSYKRFLNLVESFNRLVSRVDEIPNIYLTIQNAQLTYAKIDHYHDQRYSQIGHTHDEYAEVEHTHQYIDIEGLPDIPSGESLNQYINNLFENLRKQLIEIGYFESAKLTNGAEQGFGTTVDVIDLNLYDQLANRTFIVYPDSNFSHFPSAISNTNTWSTGVVDNTLPIALTANLQVISGGKDITDYVDDAYFLGPTSARFVSVVADQILHTNAAVLNYEHATGENNTKTPRDHSWRRTGFRFATAAWIMNEIKELFGTSKTVKDLAKLTAPSDVVSLYDTILNDTLSNGYIAINTSEKVHADTTTSAWYLCDSTPANTAALSEYPRARDYVTWLDDSYTRTFTAKQANSVDAPEALVSMNAFVDHTTLMSYQTYYKYLTANDGSITEIPRTESTVEVASDGSHRFVSDQHYRCGCISENNGVYSVEYTQEVEMFNHIFTEVNTLNATVDPNTCYYFLEDEQYTAIMGSILGSWTPGTQYYVESFAEADVNLVANGTNAFYGDIIIKKMKDIDPSILTAMKTVDTAVVTAPVAGTQYYTYDGTNYTECASDLSAWATDTVYYVADTAKRNLANRNAFAIVSKSRDLISGITANSILVQTKYKETIDAAYVPGKSYYTMTIIDNKSVLSPFYGSAFAPDTHYYEAFSLQDLFDMIAAIKQMISDGCGIYGNALAPKIVYNIDEAGGLVTWDNWKQYAYLGEGGGSSGSSLDADSLFDTIYPVGSIYTSITAKTREELPRAFREDSNGNPRYWIRIASGMCLWSAKEDNTDLGAIINEGLPVVPCGGEHSHKLRLCEYAGRSGNHPKDGNGTKGEDLTMTLVGGRHEHRGGLYGKSDHVQPQAIGVAFWKRVDESSQFLVSFKDYNGDLILNGVTPYTRTVAIGDCITPPVNPDHTAEGFTFVKWMTLDVEDNPIEFTASTPVMRSCTVVATYSYTVTTQTSNAAHGTVTVGGTKNTYDGNVVLVATPKPATTTDVYEFLNWQKAGSDLYFPTQDTTFTAGKTYYILSGGAYTAATGITAGDAVTADTYYELATDTTLTLPINDAVGQTFKAMFVAYKKLVVKGTSNSTTYGSVSGAGTYNPGDTVSLLAVPTSDNYRFDHWNTDTTDTTNPKVFQVSPTNTTTSVTHKATFVVLRKLTCELNGGSFADEIVYTELGYDGVFEEGKEYFTKSDGNYIPFTNFEVGDPINCEDTYYVKETNVFNEGSNILIVDNGTAFGSITIPTPVHPDGLTFGGWYTNTICTTAMLSATAISNNRVIYAKWS